MPLPSTPPSGPTRAVQLQGILPDSPRYPSESLDGFMMYTTPRRRSYHAFVSWKRQMIGSLASPSCWNSRLKGDVIRVVFLVDRPWEKHGKTINTWAPGMRFADTGRTWAKDGKRGGYLSISLHIHVVQ